MNDYSHITSTMRNYFDSGATFPKSFRKEQLRNLRTAILENERELFEALFSDISKPPEEAWVTEIGFVLAEIRHAIKSLDKWMRPEKVGTNLLNFPSRSYIYKEPLGVVLIIGPWNYPFQLLFAPLVGAIAAGNCVVIKPSELAPATSALLAKIIRQTFSEKYISCIEGEGSEVVPVLMNACRFDHIFYTGSTEVGRRIYLKAAEKLVPVTLELGGKSPCVVESDANIAVAAKRIALTKFSNAGQMCVAPDYVLADESIKEELVKQLVKYSNEFYDEAKLINQQSFERLLTMLHCKEPWSDVVSGGLYNKELNAIFPTVIENVTIDHPLMKEEIFGPILPVITYRSFDEAKSIIQKNPNPLAFYVFTESREKEKRWLQEIPFGGGCVNNAAWHLTNPNLPFGGRGNSGIGAYHGKFSFDVFSHHKSVMKTPTWFDPSIKYPPFKGKLKIFKKFIK